jgi:hypothetical protein
MTSFAKSLDIFRANNFNKVLLTNISAIFNDSAVAEKASEYVGLMFTNGTHNASRAAQFASAMNTFIMANFPKTNVTLESRYTNLTNGIVI